jgi:mono/diheme cytochrome c family protein
MRRSPRRVAPLLPLLLLFAWTSGAHGSELTFSARGVRQEALTPEKLSELAPAIDLRVYEPHEGRERVYRGHPVQQLLTAVHGEAWKKAELVLFTCADGYQPIVAVRKLERHQAILAFAAEGDPAFRLINKLQGDEQVPLGPYYLVWDNLSQPELKAEGGIDWPYQVVALDLIRFADRFPKMAPPENASAAAQRGFVAFQRHCMACHTINGEGGVKSIELNYPVSVTEFLDDKWLRRWIRDPQGIRFNSRMPPLGPGLADRERTIEDVVQYLKAMSRKKQL